MDRRSGILNHISSLPSIHGIGDLGRQAYLFVDNLKRYGFSIWQILPINPVGSGFSPYQAYSGFAGEPMLVSLEVLRDWGLLSAADIDSCPDFAADKVNFPKVCEFKEAMLAKAWDAFLHVADNGFLREFDRFKQEHNWWLADYALYKVCKDKYNGDAWNLWEENLKLRYSKALEAYRSEYETEIEYVKFVQFMFFRQWFQLKEYANSQGVLIFGDLPLYVSLDSSDVWGNQELFLLDEKGDPVEVGGVPPDYFSADGQLWGNPVYDWSRLAETEYHWWISRLYFNFHMFDLIRIDHFRGLESFWAVPAGSETAKSGRWMPAGGHRLLSIMSKRFSELPIIAEDLGTITHEVEKLRDDFNLPGMKVLQFGFATNFENIHLPHNFNGRNVVYTGTHDNDTLLGWIESAKGEELKRIQRFIDTDDRIEGVKNALEMAWSSTAEIAIVPMQDVLGLDGGSRMNTPGTATGNWAWRYNEDHAKLGFFDFLKDLNVKYNRSNE